MAASNTGKTVAIVAFVLILLVGVYFFYVKVIKKRTGNGTVPLSQQDSLRAQYEAQMVDWIRSQAGQPGSWYESLQRKYGRAPSTEEIIENVRFAKSNSSEVWNGYVIAQLYA